MAITKIRGNTQIIDATVTNAQIALPDAANPDGILLTKIQDGAQLVKADGSVSFTAPISGVAPVAGADLTTKDYVDSVATGLDVKESVRALSTTNITLSGAQVVDGVTLSAGDRILVSGQTDASQNGIYVVAAGAWSRAPDADNSPVGEVTSGMFTFVEEGTQYGSTGWVLATANPIVLGTTALSFVQFSEAGQVSAGAGLVANGSAIDVASANGGIVVNADNIALTVDPNGTLAVTASGVKLKDLPNGQVLIGDVSNVATAQTLSGDISITNGGVVTISADAVGTTELADDAVTQAKLADNSVGTAELIDLNVTTAKLADASVTTAKLADAAVTLAKLESGTAGQIIVAGATGVPAYQTMSGDATIDAAGSLQIAASAVGTTELADGAVATAKIADDAVTTAKLAADAVTSDKIAASAVGTSEIADAAVTLGKLQTLSSTQFIIGTAGGNTAVTLSGDVTVSEAGVVSINPTTVVRVTDVITRETPSGTIDGTNPTFVLANTPKAGTEHVYFNGVLQDSGAGNDYTISGATITFLFNPVSGDKIRVSYFK